MSLFNAIRNAVRLIPSVIERTGGMIQLVIRLFSAAYLGLLGCIALYIALAALLEIARDPLHADVVVLSFLTGCVPVAYVLLLLSWRALTNRSSRPDGGLLPPFAIRIFAILWGGIGLYGLVGNLLAGHVPRVLGGAVVVLGAVGVVASSRLRERLAKASQRLM